MCEEVEDIPSEMGGEGVALDIIIDTCHGDYMVWEPSHAFHIRKNHRIVGTSAGSLPWKPRQNGHLGLPVQLTKYDTAYLLQYGSAKVRDSSMFNKEEYSEIERTRISKKRKHQRDIQIELLKEQKATELDTLSPVIMQGKKAKQAKSKILTVESERPLTDKDSDEESQYEDFKNSELQKTKRFGYEHVWVEMPTKSSLANTLRFLEDHKIQFSPEESLRYAVFCDLHDQGFYVANGTKFGGDFLVYPGDPVCYHSFYIALCVPHDKKMCGYEYSALGRLASTVKKTLLLCSKSKRGHIEYLSMSWTGVVP